MKEFFDFTWYLAGTSFLSFISITFIALCVMIVIPMLKDIWAGLWREGP